MCRSISSSSSSKNDQIMMNNEWILINLNLHKKCNENPLVDFLKYFLKDKNVSRVTNEKKEEKIFIILIDKIGLIDYPPR